MVALAALSLAGCSGGTVEPDAATSTMPDAFVASTDDAATTVMDDAAMTAMDDAAMASDAATPAVTWGDVHAALRANCTPCHATGGSGGHNMAQTDATMAYADSQLMGSGGACASSITKGACAAMRVHAGSMPPGGGLAEPTRSEVAALLDGWVAAGQPAP